MSKVRELVEKGQYGELWQVCCGFIDLRIDQFMNIQQQLLLEQIELLKQSHLGRKIMNGALPASVEEFRATVPLTTYSDYCPELLEKREDVLPAQPKFWQRTSGRSGEYACKWVPMTYAQWEEMDNIFGAVMAFGTCKERGEIPFKKNFKLLYATAPVPYAFGIFAHKLEEALGFRFLPPLSESENMSFEGRLEKGFKLALSEGIDAFYGLPGILVAIAEKFKQGSGSMKKTELLLKPKMLLRLLRGVMRSKINHRSLLPRDLWDVKFIFAAGTDSMIYKNKIHDLWGRWPLDGYGGTESIVVAMQTWDYKDMVFIPNMNFLEFIPEEEYEKGKMDKSYVPKTVLLNEVEPGKIYEIVISNFHGGALVRYRPGDMIKITSLRNDDLNINIPQMAFERRADDLIDLGLMRLTEKVIWQAIENTGVAYRDWVARKEIIEDEAFLHVYIELKHEEEIGPKSMASAVYDQLKLIDDGFIHHDVKSIEKLMKYDPVRVTILPKGSFDSYTAQRRSEGADLAHLKPAHINPNEKIMNTLQSQIPAQTAGAVGVI